MKTKKNPIRIFILIFLCLLLLEAAVVVVIDPFFHYHKPLADFPYIIDNQQSQNPGIAKFFDYDSVLLGSSMVSNFDTSRFNDSGRVQKISYNAATAKDISNSLEMVFDAKENIKKVYICVDILNWTGDTEITGYGLPEYLYDNNPFNDVEYIYNLDVLLEYCIKPLFTPEDKTNIDRVYHLEFLDELYNAEFAMSNYEPEEVTDDISEDKYISSLDANLKKNIIPYVEAYPETEFILFFPPYSIVYWYDLARTKNLNATITTMEYLADTLSEYVNVCIFDFSLLEGFEDMNNYVDPKHYHERLCDRMIAGFGGSNYFVNKDSVSYHFIQLDEYMLKTKDMSLQPGDR